MGFHENRSHCDEFRGREPAGVTGQDFVWFRADEKSGDRQMNARAGRTPELARLPLRPTSMWLRLVVTASPGPTPCGRDSRRPPENLTQMQKHRGLQES